MKWLFKNIIREQLSDEDYEYIDKGDEIFDIRVRDLKIIQMVVKQINGGHVDNHTKNHFLSILRAKFAIEDPEILSKLLIIAFYNTKEELELAAEQKDPEMIYKGPFFMHDVEYWGDVSMQNVDVDTECESCGGDGTGEQTCGNCYGTGWEDPSDCSECDGTGIDSEDDEECLECGGEGELSLGCDTCHGSGEEETDCEECSGHGSYATSEEQYEVDKWQTLVITTEPIALSMFSDSSDVFLKSVLYGKDDWVTHEISSSKSEIYEYEGMLEDISDYEVITKGMSVMRHF